MKFVSCLAMAAVAVSAHGHHKPMGGLFTSYTDPNIDLEELGEVCEEDGDRFCSEVIQQENLVLNIECGRKHHSKISKQCKDKIQEYYPALWVCATEVAAVCPEVGNLRPYDHDGDQEEDDDDRDEGRGGGRRDRLGDRQERMLVGPRCINHHMTSFSPNCTNAINKQWETMKAGMGLPTDYEPMADDVYQMFSPPSDDFDMDKQHVLQMGMLFILFATCLTCVGCGIYGMVRSNRSSPRLAAPPLSHQAQQAAPIHVPRAPGAYTQLRAQAIPVQYTVGGFAAPAAVAAVAAPTAQPVSYHVSADQVPVAMPA